MHMNLLNCKLNISTLKTQWKNTHHKGVVGNCFEASTRYGRIRIGEHKFNSDVFILYYHQKYANKLCFIASTLYMIFDKLLLFNLFGY